MTSVVAPVCHTPPPRLDVLCELPADGLVRTSTFRSSLEKAVDDINDKYKENVPPKKVPVLRIDTRSPPLSGNVTFPRYATRLPGGRPPAHTAGSLRGARMTYRPISIDPAYNVLKHDLPERLSVQNDTIQSSNPFTRADIGHYGDRDTEAMGHSLEEEPAIVELADTSLSCPNQITIYPPSPAAPSSQKATHSTDSETRSSHSTRSTLADDEVKKEKCQTGEDGVSENSNTEASQGDENHTPVSEESADGVYDDPFGDLQATEVEEAYMSGALAGSTPSCSSPAADGGLDDANDIQGIGNREFMIQDYALQAFEGIEMQRNPGYRTSSAPSVAELVNKFRRMQHLPEVPTDDSDADTVCLIDKLCQRQGSGTSYEEAEQVSSGDEGSLTDAFGRERSNGTPHPYGAF
ncbi:hypothetical protein VHEMI01524 [[Torrubiella] hemipterigena]|uniref:Uncharacterized protein n=1 Tax=[Torrubiella] hemipterigena TaxID=1531966 RepID=A0A0A1T502_9HYPO|nr:hypothetical protein VHEMI01524 [[Torrubiella] hemipterigena]